MVMTLNILAPISFQTRDDLVMNSNDVHDFVVVLTHPLHPVRAIGGLSVTLRNFKLTQIHEAVENTKTSCTPELQDMVQLRQKSNTSNNSRVNNFEFC